MRTTIYYAPPEDDSANGCYILTPGRGVDPSGFQKCTLILPPGYGIGTEPITKGRIYYTYILTPEGVKLYKLGTVGHTGAPTLEYYADGSNKHFRGFCRVTCDVIAPWTMQMVTAYGYDTAGQKEGRWTMTPPSEYGPYPDRIAAVYLPTTFPLCRAKRGAEDISFLHPSMALRAGTLGTEEVCLAPDFTGLDDQGNLFIDLTPIRNALLSAHYKAPERISCYWAEPGDIWDAEASAAWLSSENFGLQVEIGLGGCTTILMDAPPAGAAWLDPRRVAP